MRTPEIRPLQNRHRVARASKTEIRSFSDRCTNAVDRSFVRRGHLHFRKHPSNSKPV